MMCVGRLGMVHGDVEALLPKQPLSFDGLGHYSRDFGQQVHFPSNPLQHGPIYFKTPPRLMTANTVISLIHYFFDNCGMEGKHVHQCGNEQGDDVFVSIYDFASFLAKYLF